MPPSSANATPTRAPSAPNRADPLATLPRLDRHKPKCGPVRKSKAGRWRALVLILVHVLIGLHILHWLWTGRSITPVEPSEAMQAFEMGRLNAGFVLFLVLIVGTLVFGRWFCGWACHVVALQDLSAWLLGKVGLRPRPVRSRLLVFAPFAVGGYMFVWPQLEQWLWPAERRLVPVSQWEPHFTTESLWATFPGPLMGVLTFVVVGFLVVWWMGAKGFCTYGCPYGAFFGVADRFAPGRIVVTPDCDACGHCTSVCSSNVRVHEEVAKHGQIVDPGCMKCMDCVSVCPKDALHFGFARPRPLTMSQQRIRARGDFTWPEELLLAAVAFTATQWAWRSAWFGEPIPLLMAVGLGVLTAAAAVVVLRLLRRPDVALQHTPLKVGGRRTRAGRWALAGCSIWLVLAVHTGVVLAGTDSANKAAWELLRQQRADRGSVTAAQLDVSAERLEFWRAAALAVDPGVLAMQGLVLRELDRHQEAVAALESMMARQWSDRRRWPDAEIALAIYYAQMGRLDDAGNLAEQVLRERPGDATATAMLRQFGRLR